MALAVMIVGLGSVPAKAEAARGDASAGAAVVKLAYTLAIFSIPFGHIDYSLELAPGSYRAGMQFQTSGLAAALWKSRIVTTAEGRAAPAALLPDRYTSHSFSRSGKEQQVQVDYRTQGAPVMTADPPYDLSRNPVPDWQKRGAVDPLTAISSVILGLGRMTRAPCRRTLFIFDGRRRYDVIFMPAEDAAALPGAAPPNRRLCKAEYHPISGLKQEVVAVESVPSMIAELIDVSEGSRRYTVAARIRSSFLFGAVSAEVSEVSINGHPVSINR